MSQASPWVDAAPFRAHLRHLMSIGDLSVDEVAQLTGVAPRAAHALLHGRDGRPLRRINPETARRLLQVSSADARSLGRRLVPATATVSRLHQLVSAGVSLLEVAHQTRVEAGLLLDLVQGRRSECSHLVAARVGALHARLTGYPLAS
jgi:hypothetical protein